MQVDYIIVGQGLAGSALASHMLWSGKKIMVYDLPIKNSASKVAAGLFNPITGKVMGKTWQADSLFTYLPEFYKRVELQTKRRFLYEIPIYRPFLSVQEQNEWMSSCHESIYKPFVEEIFTSPKFVEWHNEFGGLLLKKGGYLDTKVYLGSVRDWLISAGSYQEENFDVEKLLVTENVITYNNVISRGIVFCQGVWSRDNKFFNWLPLNPLKGETLTIAIENLRRDVLVNRGVYVVPQTLNRWKVGATYSRELSENPTESGRQELETKMNELLKVRVEVVDQEVGFRPTTPDRRPLIGCHSKWSNIMIFNGLGTKGVSIAPYFAHKFVQSLEKGEVLSDEVGIKRFKSLY